MSSKFIVNPRVGDTNVSRNIPPKPTSYQMSLLPSDFVVNAAELDVLKWALQFYMYQEKQQKVSGKIYIAEITEEKKNIATELLKKIM